MDQAVKQRLKKAAGILLVLAACSVFVVFVWHPSCFILEITGCYCAGCGGQRLVYALLRGDFSGALRQNPFLFFALPSGAVYGLAEIARYVRGKKPLFKSRWALPAFMAVLAAALVFTVLRNLPGFSFLGPVPR